MRIVNNVNCYVMMTNIQISKDRDTGKKTKYFYIEIKQDVFPLDSIL